MVPSVLDSQLEMLPCTYIQRQEPRRMSTRQSTTQYKHLYESLQLQESISAGSGPSLCASRVHTVCILVTGRSCVYSVCITVTV